MLYENSRVSLACRNDSHPALPRRILVNIFFLIKSLQSYYMTQSDFHRAPLSSKDLKLHRRSKHINARMPERLHASNVFRA